MEGNSVRPERSGARIHWVDVLKGFGICTVYIAHTQHAEMAFPLFMLCTVQLFFFVSGFFVEKHVGDPFFSSLFVRFKKLMIPYLIFSLATYALSFCDASAIRPNLAPLPNLAKIALGVREHTLAPALWFFPCLVLVDIMYMAIRRAAAKIFPNHPFAFVLPVSLLLSLAGMGIRYWLTYCEPWPHASFGLPWNPGWALEFLLYFALGAALFPRIRDFHWRSAPLPVRIFTGIAWFAAAWITISIPAGLEPWRSFGVTLYGFPMLPMFFLRTAYTIVVLFALVGAAKMIGPRSPFLAVIGRKTLLLCGSEVLSIILMVNFLTILRVAPDLSSSAFHAVLWALVSLLIAYKIFVPFFERLFPEWCGKIKRPCRICRCE